MSQRVRPAWRPFPIRPWVGHPRRHSETVHLNGSHDRDTGRPYAGKGTLNKPNIMPKHRRGQRT